MGSHPTAYIGYGAEVNSEGPWPDWIDEEEDLEEQLEERLAEIFGVPFYQVPIQIYRPGNMTYGPDDENYVLIVKESLSRGDAYCTTVIDPDELRNAPTDEWAQPLGRALEGLNIGRSVVDTGWLLWAVYG